MSASDLPMCPQCHAILNDDGSCPDVDDHGAVDLAELWAERHFAEREQDHS